eukprot:1336204-Rhodomonas_salina.1
MVETVTLDSEKQTYLDRANNDIRAGRTPFTSFESTMITGFRTSEWGNSDCIRHVTHITGSSVVSLIQGASPMYYQWGNELR